MKQRVFTLLRTTARGQVLPRPGDEQSHAQEKKLHVRRDVNEVTNCERASCKSAFSLLREIQHSPSGVQTFFRAILDLVLRLCTLKSFNLGRKPERFWGK